MDLKHHSKSKGIKQREIAERIGVTEAAVSLWFSRQVDIPVRHIQPLASLLDLPVADVVAVATRSKDAA